MNKTVAYALDFMLDTLDYSPDDTIVPTLEADLRLQPTGDPMEKEHWSVVLWNDEKHCFEEVIQFLIETTNRSREDASVMADRIDDLGREVIEMGPDVTRLHEIALTIAQIELGVTVRRSYDTFREQIVAVIIEWLLDLTRSRLGTDAVILREIIAEELLMPRRRNNGTTNAPPDVTRIYAEVNQPARIEWLFLYHAKLWKRTRLSLKEIYASILNLSPQHRLAVGKCSSHSVVS